MSGNLPLISLLSSLEKSFAMACAVIVDIIRTETAAAVKKTCSFNGMSVLTLKGMSSLTIGDVFIFEAKTN
jgi:hypothetical protein